MERRKSTRPDTEQIYAEEFSVLDHARAISQRTDIDLAQLRQEYAHLVDQFGRLLRGTFKLTRIGDASQRKLLQAYEQIEEQQAALRKADLELTEAQLKQSEAERAELRTQLTQAQKMEAVGRLTGGVAHDFNNMLGVILGHAELTLMRLDQSDLAYRSIIEIENAAKRSADLTRSLLAFSRKQTATLAILDLNDTIKGMLNILTRLIGEDVELTWLPGSDLQPVRMAPSQVDQIVANLCVNARDAISGVGKICIETGNAAVDSAQCTAHPECSPGSYVMLAVSDTGCGMDQETILKLFEPFFTTKTAGQGTGLGLATISEIVRQNRGFIHVDSELGHGSSFKIYIPAHTKASREERTEEATPETSTGSETVLLVEDEPMMLEMAGRMLEQSGYRVLPASTPGEAIRIAADHRGTIRLLLTDVIMPEMNGRDLARKIIETHPDISRVFMSGYTADAIARYGVLDKGVHFIQKPFSQKQLAAVVRQAIDAGNR